MAERKKTAIVKAAATAGGGGKPPAKAAGPCLSMAQQRKLAKDAMTISMAVLTVTAMTGVRRRGLSRSLHLASGVALIGFSLWHNSLYPSRKAAKCPDTAQ